MSFGLIKYYFLSFILFGTYTVIINLPETVSQSWCTKQIDSCSCQSADGSRSINLNPLTSIKSVFTAVDSQQINYFWKPCAKTGNVCGVLPNTLPNAAICQFDGRTPVIIGDPTPVTFVYDTTNLFQLMYRHQDGSARTTLIRLVCNGGMDGAVFTVLPEGRHDEQGYHYNLQIESKYACETSPSGNSSLSAGTILLIIFLVLLIIYLVGGILFDIFYFKRSGIDVIPNVSFWALLPTLIKEGVLFLFHCVKRDGQSSSYTNIK